MYIFHLQIRILKVSVCPIKPKRGRWFNKWEKKVDMLTRKTWLLLVILPLISIKTLNIYLAYLNLNYKIKPDFFA